MKKLLPNLVLTLVLALCALCVAQWVREARLRAETASLQRTRIILEQTLASTEALAKRYEGEIARLDARAKELERAGETNAVTIAVLQSGLHRSETEGETLRKELAGYKEAVDQQNQNLRRQNEVVVQQNASIKEQNESLKRLAAERNEVVEKLNGRIREFNEMVGKYNDLVKQMEQLQSKAAAK